MPHTPSQFMYRMSLDNRYRIKYLQLAEKLLQFGLIEFKYRNSIDIRYFVIGKYAIAQIKDSHDAIYYRRDLLYLEKNSLDNYYKLIRSFSELESLAREVLRGRMGIC
ncbi:MAG: hypothetical protein ACKN92_05200 [Candidatus Nanopelagicaceae bacterium]